MCPLGLYLCRELGQAQFFHENLDPRLIHIVATAEAIVDAQDGVEIRKQMLPR